MSKTLYLGVALVWTLTSTAIADDKKQEEADFDGAYSYTSTFTISLTSPQKQTVTDTDEGTLTISRSKKSGLVLTFTAKGETCQLTATRSGKQGIKVPAGQTCSQTDSATRSDFTLTLTTGSGTLTNDNLTMNLGWKLSGSVAGVAVSGRATEAVQAEQK